MMYDDDDTNVNNYLDTYVDTISDLQVSKDFQNLQDNVPVYSKSNSPHTVNGVYMPAEEIRNCIQKYRETGDKTYRDKVIMGHFDLVHYVIHRYRYDLLATNNGNFDYDDIFQAGLEGLMSAVNHFDVDYGTTFITYAYYWVRQAMQRCILELRGFRLPVHLRERLNKILYIRNVLSDAGVEPTVAALSQETGLSEEYLSRLLQHDIQMISLDATVSEEMCGTRTYGEILSDIHADTEQKLTESALLTAVVNTVNKQTDRTRDILSMRLGINGYAHPYTLQEIANKHGLSRERVRQVAEKYLRQLKYDKQIRTIAKEYGYDTLSETAQTEQTAYWTYSR